MAVNRDCSDLLSALNASGAKFLVVGAHAVMLYTSPRYTKDLDIWTKPSRENAPLVRKALSEFGAPIGDLSESDLSVEGTIVQIGIAPNRIDILTSIEALAFDACYARACETSYGGVSIRALSKDELITNKRAVGRKQDLLDVENLEKV